MNRRNIIIFIISGIVIIALIASGFAIKYYTAFKKVTVTTVQQDLTADVYQRNPNSDGPDGDTKVGTVHGTKVFSLQPGKYYAIAEGTKYDKSQQISFTVDSKDFSVTVNPSFSDDYLVELFKQQIATIRNLIATKYASIIGNYTINPGKLYLDGTWYGTTLVGKSPSPGELGDTYRIVLHKVNNTWTIAAAPAIVLSAPDYKDIPFTILSDLNTQSGY